MIKPIPRMLSVRELDEFFIDAQPPAAIFNCADCGCFVHLEVGTVEDDCVLCESCNSLHKDRMS